MKAFIIYDNFASAAKANAALHRAGSRPDFPVSWNVSPWRGDALRLSPLADEVLEQELDAHLVILAGQRVQTFPTWLERWMERWATRRQIQDAAIAIISDHEDASAFSVVPVLTRFARRHGLGFIFNDQGSVSGEATFFGRHSPKINPPVPQTPSIIKSSQTHHIISDRPEPPPMTAGPNP